MLCLHLNRCTPQDARQNEMCQQKLRQLCLTNRTIVLRLEFYPEFMGLCQL